MVLLEAESRAGSLRLGETLNFTADAGLAPVLCGIGIRLYLQHEGRSQESERWLVVPSVAMQ